MQIICNNCGNEIEFPNRQVYVTCPHCYTHLQIEEHDNRIFATIVEEKDIDNSIFQNNRLINTDLPNALYDLLHLEGELKEIKEETAFYSLSQRKKNRPSRFRAIFRLILFVLSSYWFLNGLRYFLQYGGDNWELFLGFLFLAYAVFMLIIGIKEFRKAIELQRFEKFYYREREDLLTALSDENLPDSINNRLDELSKNYEEEQEIVKEFFYVELFNALRIKLGVPSISKGLRVFAIGIPSGLIALGVGLNGYGFAFLFAALAIFSVFFGFFVLGDSNEYKRTSELNETKRIAILERLRQLIR